MTIDGTGSGYIYSALTDSYISKVSGILTNPITGFYTPLGAAPTAPVTSVILQGLR